MKTELKRYTGAVVSPSHLNLLVQPAFINVFYFMW